MKEEKPILSFRDKHLFLSNFFYTPIVYEGLTFASVEHAYQAAKTTDIAIRQCFQAEDMTSAEARQLGKDVPLRDDWAEVKYPIMRELLYQKFQNDALRALLLMTGTAPLIEGNHWGDTYWGVDLRTMTGENYLGKLLMEIRESLKHAQHS